MSPFFPEITLHSGVLTALGFGLAVLAAVLLYEWGVVREQSLSEAMTIGIAGLYAVTLMTGLAMAVAIPIAIPAVFGAQRLGHRVGQRMFQRP